MSVDEATGGNCFLLLVIRIISHLSVLNLVRSFSRICRLSMSSCYMSVPSVVLTLRYRKQLSTNSRTVEDAWLGGSFTYLKVENGCEYSCLWDA